MRFSGNYGGNFFGGRKNLLEVRTETHQTKRINNHFSTDFRVAKNIANRNNPIKFTVETVCDRYHDLPVHWSTDLTTNLSKNAPETNNRTPFDQQLPQNRSKLIIIDGQKPAQNCHEEEIDVVNK